MITRKDGEGWGLALPLIVLAPPCLRPRSMRIAEETVTDPQSCGVLATPNGVFNLLKDNLIITARGTS